MRLQNYQPKGMNIKLKYIDWDQICEVFSLIIMIIIKGTQNAYKKKTIRTFTKL